MTHASSLATLPTPTSFIPEDNAALSNEITRLAGHINAAQHRFLKLLAVLIERNAWEGAGMKSPAHWLNYYCGIDLGAAREKVRVAKCLQNFLGIDEAFRTGEISYSKVRAMTRLTTPGHEAMLLQVARHGTAFMKAIDAMVSALNPSMAGSEELEESEEEITEKMFPQKRADALLALGEQAMSTMEEGLQPLSSAEKYQVMVHIERERVAEGVLHTDHHHCSVECGTDHFPLSSATARRLCCDASIVIVLEDSRGDVLNVGRRTRTIPPSIRRALQVRDGGGGSAI